MHRVGLVGEVGRRTARDTVASQRDAEGVPEHCDVAVDPEHLCHATLSVRLGVGARVKARVRAWSGFGQGSVRLGEHRAHARRNEGEVDQLPLEPSEHLVRQSVARALRWPVRTGGALGPTARLAKTQRTVPSPEARRQSGHLSVQQQ